METSTRNFDVSSKSGNCRSQSNYKVKVHNERYKVGTQAYHPTACAKTSKSNFEYNFKHINPKLKNTFWLNDLKNST